MSPIIIIRFIRPELLISIIEFIFAGKNIKINFKSKNLVFGEIISISGENKKIIVFNLIGFREVGIRVG